MHAGTDVMILKIFLPKNSAKNWRFWLKPKLNYAKNYHNIGFWEKTPFFRQTLSKIAEIVIITSTPGRSNHQIIMGLAPAGMPRLLHLINTQK
jgi:hypothetical protein